MTFTNDVVIGLEIHIQLDTKTKLFSSAPTSGSEEPNSRCALVDVGMPGSRPVINKQAVDHALKLCLAMECDIAPTLIFSRKSYFYPDMAKNYQITQYEEPLGKEGVMKLVNGEEIGITRIHLEEDPASLVHPSGMHSSSYVLIDYNRSGNPLCELVTKPELTSPEEARDFMKQLITTLYYLHIYDGGIIKADANVSIKEKKYTRVEIKNITGFKELERALTFEIERQKKEDVVQETRSWDAQTGVTKSLRKKETEEEYGYILDPDLPEVTITEEMKKVTLPELPAAKAQRFVKKLKIKEEDARIIAQDYLLADMFEKAIKNVSPSVAVTWIRHELNRVLNYQKKTLEEVDLDEDQFLVLIGLVGEKKLTENAAKKILNELIVKKFDVLSHVKKEGLEAVTDTGAIETVCKKIIADNKEAVEDYKKGNEKSLNFLVGKVMRETKGAASPDVVLEKIKELV